MLERLFTRGERAALGFLLLVGFGGLFLIALGKLLPALAPPWVELEVHVNRATAEELATLPGIGPKLAQRIVEDRKRHGRYLTLTDLSRVKGMTPRVLSKLKGLVQFD